MRPGRTWRGSRGRDSDAGGAGKDSGTLDAAQDVSSDSLPAACPSSVPSGSCSLAQATLCYYGDDSRWFCKTSALFHEFTVVDWLSPLLK
jgi:hypothetical protein